ncbi:AbrB/MazE/SpoVT family DNA-binding domain-containing protein [Nitrospira sp. Kam-Ns4a]
MKSFRTHLSQGGRVVIPADYREALGLKPGDDVMLFLEENEVRLITPHQAVKRAQSLVRQYVPPGRTLTEELLKDRRQEVRLGTRKRTTMSGRS